jgi:hypothetical protein
MEGFTRNNMNNHNCADRLQAGNRVISVSAIAYADFDETEGLMIAFQGLEEPMTLQGKEGEAVWQYLTARAYGCVNVALFSKKES